MVSPEMSLVLELTVEQQALLYITAEEQSNAQSFPSPDLKSSVSASLCDCAHPCMRPLVFVCVCGYFFFFFSVRELLPFLYQSVWVESACRGVSGGLRYSACCQHRHISPSAPLHRYANPASSECRAPDQLQFIPFCSLPLDVLVLPPYLPPHLSLLFLLSLVFLFGPSCSVHGICPQWGIIERWKDFFWVPSSLNSLHRNVSSFSISWKRWKIAWVCSFLLLPVFVLVLA